VTGIVRRPLKRGLRGHRHAERPVRARVLRAADCDPPRGI